MNSSPANKYFVCVNGSAPSSRRKPLSGIKSEISRQRKIPRAAGEAQRRNEQGRRTEKQTHEKCGKSAAFSCARLPEGRFRKSEQIEQQKMQDPALQNRASHAPGAAEKHRQGGKGGGDAEPGPLKGDPAVSQKQRQQKVRRDRPYAEGKQQDPKRAQLGAEDHPAEIPEPRHKDAPLKFRRRRPPRPSEKRRLFIVRLFPFFRLTGAPESPGEKRGHGGKGKRHLPYFTGQISEKHVRPRQIEVAALFPFPFFFFLHAFLVFLCGSPRFVFKPGFPGLSLFLSLFISVSHKRSGLCFFVFSSAAR